MYPGAAKSKIETLEKIGAEIHQLANRLSLSDRGELELSITQAKQGLADAEKWVADAVLCLKIDHGIPLDA